MIEVLGCIQCNLEAALLRPVGDLPGGFIALQSADLVYVIEHEVLQVDLDVVEALSQRVFDLGGDLHIAPPAWYAKASLASNLDRVQVAL